ncbi:MAG: class I SAM-dependent methyltransferase [bacterium]
MKNTNFEGLGKYKEIDKKYFNYLDELSKMEIPERDFIFQFPVFVGQVNLARYLFFYDLYKQIIELNGHIADVGTFKGSSFLFMAKMIKLFEPYNTTQVYGFDWFEGMAPSSQDDKNQEGKYKADFATLSKLIELQELKDVAILNKMDITKELAAFMKERPQLRFKMVFIDCGIKEVMESSLEYFWPRLVKGGILIMDHYNMEVSPSESLILEKHVGDNLIKQMPFVRQPTCYVIKEK